MTLALKTVFNQAEFTKVLITQALLLLKKYLKSLFRRRILVTSPVKKQQKEIILPLVLDKPKTLTMIPKLAENLPLSKSKLKRALIYLAILLK